MGISFKGVIECLVYCYFSGLNLISEAITLLLVHIRFNIFLTNREHLIFQFLISKSERAGIRRFNTIVD